jgi:hypothetical protein
VRLTPEQKAWLELQTRCGSLSRSAAIRLCIQRAMADPQPLTAADQQQGQPEQGQ